MPVATVVPVLASYFDFDQDTVTTSIVISTILAIVMLPLWAKVLL